jgi:hypothetical protein
VRGLHRTSLIGDENIFAGQCDSLVITLKLPLRGAAQQFAFPADSAPNSAIRAKIYIHF